MWLGNVKGYRRTWNEREILGLSDFLINCNATRPSDLHRSIRPLNHVKRWKGTEFRTFLLYIGIVALHNRLRQTEYEMFLKLFCGVTICSSSLYVRYLPLARKLFSDFIEEHINIFGEGSITINIHNTCHVVDEVENFGPLESISAYPFENHLHHLKLKLKQCNKPLQQIARRIVESTQSTKFVLSNDENLPILKFPFKFDDDSLGYHYIEYKHKVYLSSAKQNKKDKWFLTFNNEIVEFSHVSKNVREQNIIIGSPAENVGLFFEKPFRSSYLNIFLCGSEKADPKEYKLSEIKAKMFCLNLNDSQFVFIPLLHSL